MMLTPGAGRAQSMTLRAAAGAAGIRYGAAIEPQTVETDAAFAALVREQCAVLTAENALKWDALRPGPDRFDFSAADRVAEIARRWGLPMHGHTLVWHEALPDWTRAALAGGQDPTALLTQHITRVVSRYAGVVASWDVVNEFVERNDRRPDGLRRSPWLEAIGPDYIEIALRAAHAADPAARLTVSDYGLEYDDESWMVEKRGTMLRMLRRLKDRGAPLHALGIQGHLLGDRRPAFGAGLARFLADVGALGLDIYVTELDVKDQNTPGGVAERDRIVADIYNAFLRTVLDQPAARQVVTWGLSDRYTAQASFFPRPDGAAVRPLPFDSDFAPKPAAFAMARAFRARSGA
jgi:endo-1,4-beta-xylanase